MHGGTEREMEREVAKGGFKNVHEMVSFLDEGLRAVLYWLGDKPLSERPYKDPSGWETLLWQD